MRRMLTGLGGLLLSLVVCSSLWAQATAQISGTVQDASGAVLPGAEIVVSRPIPEPAG